MAGVLWAGVLSACGDSAGPRGIGPRGSAALTLVSLPPDSALPLRVVTFGAVLRYDRLPASARLILDAGLPTEQVVREHDLRPAYGGAKPSGDTLRLWVPVPFGDGRHRITIEATDSAGRSERATFEREFRFATADYTAAELDAGGADAEALGLNEQGDAAGWVARPSGRPRPAAWRGGRLELLPTPDTTVRWAVRINAAGDVLGDGVVGNGVADSAWARVWRADGRVLEIGPVTIPDLLLGGTATVTCCTRAADLTDDRTALAFVSGMVAMDVASGTTRVLSDRYFQSFPVSLTERGRVVVSQQGSPDFGGQAIALDGGPLPAFTERLCLPPQGRPVYGVAPLVAGADGELLASISCDGLAFASATVPSLSLATLLGFGATGTMSRRGAVVAARDPADSALYVWRAGDAAARRVRWDAARWRVDRVTAVNARGVIAVAAVDASTGRRAALLLTPAAP